MQNTNISPTGIGQGSFSVDASGQAMYNLPLELPPGIAGLQPGLSISYGHRSPNGMLGVGCSLSGLSAITRTKATYAQDGFIGGVNYDKNDRLMLDGQRLINISGSYWDAGIVYNTEINSFITVSAVNPDDENLVDGILAYMPNGEIWTYGTTADSLIYANGPDTNIRLWALAMITDVYGNSVQYTYITNNDSSFYYPSKISLFAQGNPNPNWTVNFTYISRPDQLVYYVGGYEITIGSLLSTISVTVQGIANPVRCYSLNYAPFITGNLSCLESLTLTGADGTSQINNLFQLSWPGNSDFSFTPQTSTSLYTDSANVLATLPMDINGDGCTEVVLIVENSGSIQAQIFLPDTQNQQTSYISGGNVSLNNYNNAQYFAADVDGDGQCDLVVVYPGGENSTTLCFDVYLSSNGTFASSPLTTATSDTWPDSQIKFYAMDVNGTGTTDIVMAFNDSDNSNNLTINTYFSSTGVNQAAFTGFINEQNFQTIFSSGTVQEIWPIDVNGDGMTELVVLYTDNGNWYVCSLLSQSSPGSFLPFSSVLTPVNLGYTSNNTIQIVPTDANGDGIIDLVVALTSVCGTSGVVTTIQSWLSDGAGGFILTGAQTQLPAMLEAGTSWLLPMGMGGFMTNLAFCQNNSKGTTITVFNSSPSGVYSNGSPVFPPNQSSNFFLGDATGNGIADIFQIFLQPGNVCLQPLLANWSYPYQVSSISDASGSMVNITYSPLSNSSVYTNGNYTYPSTSSLRYSSHLTPSQYPMETVIGGAMYVVSDYTISNNATINNNSYSQTFSLSYAGGSLDLSGRGWQGFAQMNVCDQLTGLATVTNYLQTFPFTGMTYNVQALANGSISNDPKIQPPGNTACLLHQSLNFYQSVPASVNPGATYLVQKTFGLDYHYYYGNFDYLLAKSIDLYDNYNNPLQETWLGYIDFIEPNTLNALGPLPTRTQINPNESVYTYRTFNLIQNPDNPGLILGLPLYVKVSANSADADILQFNAGDLSLQSFTYSELGEVSTKSAWDSSNEVWLTSTYTYDGYGNLLTQTDPGGLTTTYSYETTYNTFPQSMITPAAVPGTEPFVSQVGYDPRFGIKVAEQNINGIVTISGLDAFGRQIATQGPVPEGCNQSDANLLTGLNVTGNSAQFSSASVLTLATTSFVSDALGNVYIQKSSLQNFPTDSKRVWLSGQTFIDMLGRTVITNTETENHGVWSSVTTTYAPCGKPAQQSLPFFNNTNPDFYTEYTYDVLGRPLTVTAPSANNETPTRTDSWNYQAGEIVTTTKAAGTPTEYSQTLISQYYNGKPQTVSSVIISDNNSTTIFTFDILGRMVASTDPIGIVNTITYDSLNRTLTNDNPDQNTTGNSETKAGTYTYSAVTGQLSSVTDASAATCTYTYDTLNRLLNKTYSDGRSISYAYDQASNGLGAISSISVSSATGQESLTTINAYDVYGRITHKINSIGSSSWTSASGYDPQGRLISKTYPDGSVLNKEYQFGLLQSQTLDGVQITFGDFTPQGNSNLVTYQTFASIFPSLSAKYSRNALDMISSEILSNPINTLLNYTYQYDVLNQLLSQEDAVSLATESYAYTNLRLTQFNSSQVPGSSTVYNGGGNITALNGNTYTYQNSHFPVSIGSNYSASQDACGRTMSRTMDGNTLDLNYNNQGCLLSISNGSTSLQSNLYNASGQRIQSIQEDGTTAVYIGAAYIELTSPAGIKTVQKFMFDGQGAMAMIETTGGQEPKISFLRHDLKGSITHIFDTAGALQTLIAYNSYGTPTIIQGHDTCPLKYESKLWDSSTGFYYFNARFYDPFTGRFISPDTVLGGSSHLQADVWNRFAFELNNPRYYIDPTGHFSWVAFGAGILSVVAGLAVMAVAGDTGIGAAIGAGLISGGVSGISYVISHSSDFSWKAFGITYAVNAGIGALGGGAGFGVDFLTEGASVVRTATGFVAKSLFAGVENFLADSIETAASGDGWIGSQTAVKDLLIGMAFGAGGELAGMGVKQLSSTMKWSLHKDLFNENLESEEDALNRLGQPLLSINGDDTGADWTRGQYDKIDELKGIESGFLNSMKRASVIKNVYTLKISLPNRIWEPVISAAIGYGEGWYPWLQKGKEKFIG